MRLKLKSLILIVLLGSCYGGSYRSSYRTVSYKTSNYSSGMKNKNYYQNTSRQNSQQNYVRPKVYVSQSGGKSYTYKSNPQSYFNNKTINNPNNISTERSNSNGFFTGMLTYYLLFGGNNHSSQITTNNNNNIINNQNNDNDTDNETINVKENPDFILPLSFTPYNYQVESFFNFRPEETYGKVNFIAGNGSLVAYSTQSGIYFFDNNKCNVSNEQLKLVKDEEIISFTFDTKTSLLALTNKNNIKKVTNLCSKKIMESDIKSTQPDDYNELQNIINQANKRTYYNNLAVMINSDNNSLLFKNLKNNNISINFPVAINFCSPLSTDINNHKILDHIDYNCPEGDIYNITGLANSKNKIYINTSKNLYSFEIYKKEKLIPFESYLPLFSELKPTEYQQNINNIKEKQQQDEYNKLNPPKNIPQNNNNGFFDTFFKSNDDLNGFDDNINSKIYKLIHICFYLLPFVIFIHIMIFLFKRR